MKLHDSEVAEFGRGASLHRIVGLFSPAFFPVRIDSFEHLPRQFYFVNMGNSYQTTVFSHYFLYILILPKLKYKNSSFLDAQPDKFSKDPPGWQKRAPSPPLPPRHRSPPPARCGCPRSTSRSSSPTA